MSSLNSQLTLLGGCSCGRWWCLWGKGRANGCWRRLSGCGRQNFWWSDLHTGGTYWTCRWQRGCHLQRHSSRLGPFHKVPATVMSHSSEVIEHTCVEYHPLPFDLKRAHPTWWPFTCTRAAAHALAPWPIPLILPGFGHTITQGV